MRETFEEFMNSPEEVQRRLNSYMYRAWAERFNTTVEMIDRVVQHGENISYQDIDYEYCDIQADIIPSFRANSIKGIYGKPKSKIAKICESGYKITKIWTYSEESNEKEIIRDNRHIDECYEIAFLIPGTSYTMETMTGLVFTREYRWYRLEPK